METQGPKLSWARVKPCTTFVAFMHTRHRYFMLHKPYNMVSQFVSSHDVVLLTDINFEFPEGTHALGRHDNHSEGLLLLTTNKAITQKLFQGPVAHQRTYLMQVKNKVTEAALEKLRKGIPIQIKGGHYYTTMPAEVEVVDKPYELIHSTFNETEYVQRSWLLLKLFEGKYHQARKMVAGVGHKCSRLIRVAIEDLHLGDLQPGEVKELNEEDFFRLLRLE